MTSVKQPTFSTPVAPQYNTSVQPHPFKNPQEINAPPGYSQPPSDGTGFENQNNMGNEFDDLFGNNPSQKPSAASNYTTYAQPPTQGYNQQYSTTKQTPAYNSYSQPPPQQYSHPPQAKSPFDEIESSYSQFKQNPPAGNTYWQ